MLDEQFKTVRDSFIILKDLEHRTT